MIKQENLEHLKDVNGNVADLPAGDIRQKNTLAGSKKYEIDKIGMTEQEKKRYIAILKSEDKAKALVTDILAECQRQDFTVKEFEILIQKLNTQCKFEVEKIKEKTKLST
ncbi:hypothetical protein [Vallitalea guaymasensis]|uniref:hypothetical protein n=1 Tax=Vallitalea guaymasensis TaxID=1185412 RepID=UPI000DE26F61|nr:hypothetical protein [Vallitalea guaymasensis]